jgi:drug/metabolite transporter (DMT)-like permease
MPSWLPLALVSIAVGAVGQFLLKLAARSAGTLPLLGPGMLQSLGRLAANPYLLAGLVCFVGSMLLWVKVLTAAPLGTSYPLVSLGYVLVAVLSWAVLGERLGLRQVLAIGVIIGGVVLLGGRT